MDMEGYFGFGNGTGSSRMIPNNEVQRNFEALSSLNSSFQNEGDIAASFVDLPASISRMDQFNVDSFVQNTNMNSLVAGTNLLVNNNPLVQMIGSTDRDGGDTGNERKRKKMQQSTASVFDSNALGRQIVTPTFTRQDPRTLIPREKVPMLAVNNEDLFRQHLFQQLLLKQDLMQVQNQNMQLKALIQKQLQQNYLEQQILQSIPQFMRFHGLQNEDQLRHFLQCQQTPHQISSISSFPVGVCSRRVKMYLHHLGQRPQDNNIVYWRKLVAEYYAPSAKIRRCFSLYKNLNHKGLPGFLNTGKERWTCDVCGSRSGIGFVSGGSRGKIEDFRWCKCTTLNLCGSATAWSRTFRETNFEILPTIFRNIFGSDLVDEILFLEMPHESKLPSGILMLEYGKSVLETVYKQGRVVHEGKLRVLFSQDLKILSWEFCALKHEEFLVRQQISSQVARLVEAAEDCQTVGLASVEDFKSNCDKFAAVGHQLERSINLPLVNSLGLSNSYLRGLQIAEVFYSIGDLVALSAQNKIGPLECLKNYAQDESSKATQTNEITENCGTARGQSTRESTLTTASFSPGRGSVDSRLMNDKAVQAEREVSITLPNSGKIVDDHASDSPTRRMIKEEKWCLGDQMTGTPITSRMQVPQSADSSHQGTDAYVGGRMVNRLSSSSSLLEIKKEPPLF